MEYRPRQPPTLPSLDAAASLPLAERMRKLFAGTDRVGEFLRATLATGACDTPPRWRRRSRIRSTTSIARCDGDTAGRWDRSSWRTRSASTETRCGPLPWRRRTPNSRFFAARAERQRVVASNAGASLIDLGDGVLAVSLHSKMNAIGGDALEMLQRGVREAAEQFPGAGRGDRGPNFSVGANLMLLLLEAQEGNWDEIDAMIRAFQKRRPGCATRDVPVVVAPFGLTLGGGCEIVLHGDRVQAAAESYIGLVETGVGLIPAGGGTKEMLLRSGAQKAFETIGFAKMSTSAPDARRLGYLREVDGITMNRERLVVRRKAAGAGQGARGLSATATPNGDSCGRRRGSRDARSRRASGVARPAESPITTRSSAASCRGCSRAAPCLRPAPSAKIICWISSARRFSASAASQRRSSGFSTR